MKFLFYHSQLRIREHLTHKQVLLNFSNYVFFVFIRTDLVIYFRMNSISPKKCQDILMLITVGEGTISPLTHLLPVSKSIIHTQLFFAGSHWTIILFKSHNSSLLKLYGRKRPLAFAWTGMHVFLRLYGVQFTFLHNNEKEINAQMQIALLKIKSK